MEAMSHLPKVRKINSEAERQAVLAAAKADNDGIVLPTHLVEKNGEIVGAASLCVLPVLMVWSDSKKVGPKDSLILNHTYQAMLNDRGQNTYVILCNKHSPYNAHMKSFGYQSVWETEIFKSE